MLNGEPYIAHSFSCDVDNGPILKFLSWLTNWTSPTGFDKDQAMQTAIATS